MKTKLTTGILLIVACAVIMGCAAKRYDQAKQTLIVVHEVWPSVQNGFATAYAGDLITDSQWSHWVALDVKVLATHNTMVDLMILYDTAKQLGVETPNDLDAIRAMEQTLQNLYRDAVLMASEFGVKIAFEGEL